jgi:signal transduction histidine kinase
VTLTAARPSERRAPRLRSRPLRRRSAGSAHSTRAWPLQRAFAVGAAVAALVALLTVVLGGVALYRLVTERETLVDRVAPAQQAGQDLANAVLNQETGVRGYDLTTRSEFLNPYRAGIAAEERAVATLRRLTGGTELERLAPGVDAVQRAMQEWRTGYAELVIAMGGDVVGVPSADPLRGAALFDRVRAAEDALLAGLTAEQDAARQRVNDATAFLVTVGMAIAAVLGAFLLVAGIGLRRGVLQPVSGLAQQVREVVSGDVHRQVVSTGPREIVELGADVEAMRLHILRELEVLQQVNRRLDDQARDLARSNRDLEQFAYVASHDLQEPLRKVSSFCQLLQRRYGGQLDERADQYIEFAVDGAQRMQRLINDLLAFSRVGRTTAEFVPVDLDAVGTAVAAQLETSRAEVDGTITFGELPALTGDPALLRQLLLNLVGNGLKFHREGVPPQVRVSARETSGGWEISVADNGIGIEPEYVDKVFVIFQRLHGREVYAGTGIGLALAKKIVEFHGGRIWIDTEPRTEPGTTVRFTLPETPPERTAVEDPEEPQ